VTGAGLIFGVQPRGTNDLFALKSGGTGTPSDNHVAWIFDGPTPDESTPLYYKGNLYVMAGIRNGKVVTCPRLQSLTDTSLSTQQAKFSVWEIRVTASNKTNVRSYRHAE